MQIGDIEYTREIFFEPSAATSESVNVSYALGIQIRPLLVRTQVSYQFLSAATSEAIVALENGNGIPQGLTGAALMADNRAHLLYFQRRTLVTSGLANYVGPHELLWWKILLPDVTLHFVPDTVDANVKVSLHYRFATLSDQEIVEIAAQRAQG